LEGKILSKEELDQRRLENILNLVINPHNYHLPSAVCNREGNYGLILLDLEDDNQKEIYDFIRRQNESTRRRTESLRVIPKEPEE